jgi:tetratricopeptide (TPR) repeat protein
MNKQQLILIIAGVALFAGLFFFGSNVGPKKPVAEQKGPMQAQQAVSLDIDAYLAHATEHLPVRGQQYITSLEQSVKRGDVKDQQIKVYKQLAAYWKDSANDPVAYFRYLGEAATLENSEKTLTFAAQSILGYLPYTDSLSQRVWLANKSRELFEKALNINSKNDSSIVGLGSTYFYGASKTEGESPMTGIMKVREVAMRDSTNLFAQYMLGIGGLISGQYDKAVQRFEKVAKAQPDNIEVLFKLAETYENLGNKAEAIKWYQAILSKTKLPDMRAELQKRILQLKG